MKASTSLNVKIERWCEMKKFKNFGYKQETVEVREISMGNLVHIICQALIAKDKRDMEIRIVDCHAGEVDVYNGMEDLLMQDFIMDWKVNAYKIECLHNNKTDKDFLTVLVGKTQWAYGDEQPEIKLSDSSVSVGENDLYCIEKSKVANSDNLTSEEFANARTYYKEFALDPGEYYLFIKVPQTGSFAEAYSSLKEVKVIKATPTVENASLLKATYTYSSYAPVFGKIQSSELTFDGPVVKLGAEEFQALTWQLEDKELDSANNGETIKLIFTLEEGYDKYYNTPTAVDVPLEINKGSIDKPVIAEHGYAGGKENQIDIYVGEQGSVIGFDWNACSLSVTKPNGVTEKIDITDEHETHIYLDRQTDAGTYTYTVSLIDKTNYVWTDGTCGDVVQQIVIVQE